MPLGAFRLNSIAKLFAGPAIEPIVASGGTITIYNDGTDEYVVHTFLSSSTFTLSSGSGTVDALIVGGGGSGGHTATYGMGGGGGAGQVRYLTDLTAETTSVTVGAGGSTGAGSNGSASSAFGESAAGGGMGGVTSTNANNGNSVTGGSGGGGGGSYLSAGSGGTGTYNGGNARTSNEAGGGGGGAGANGANAPSSGVGGGGGAGAANTNKFQSGTQYYGGGGGGGGVTAGGGGIGGGGAGRQGSSTSSGTAGTANTGGGGGGSYSNAISAPQNNSSAGGSGIVRIRYVNQLRPYAITTNGDAQISTAQSKFGSASGLFDGSGDYLEIPNSASIFSVAPKEDRTIEFWIRPDNVTSTRALIGKRPPGGSNSEWQSWITSTGKIQFVVWRGSNTTDVNIVGTTTLSVNTWYHLAIVRSNTTWTVYLNGTSQGSATTANTPQINSSNVLIGRDRQFAPARDYDGYMDEIRISNIARYTSSFTPSASAFTPDDNTMLLLHMDGTNGATAFTDDNG